MESLFDVGYLLFGGIVLYLGAEWLVKGAAGLARAFGVRPLVVGLTVVAYGTSAPELAVSIVANLAGSTPLVFGNVVGSCIANIGLILGITALIAPPLVDPSLIRREVPVLLASALAVPVVLYDGVLTGAEGLVLLVLSIGFTVLSFTGNGGDHAASTSELEETAEAGGAPGGEGRLRLALITLVGLALLVGGGELFVDGARGIALTLGMSEQLVGLTVVALGTSLPELAASVVAALRGHSGLAVGNVIGSNIFNIFLVLGASGLVRPLPGELATMRLDLAFLVGITLLAAVVMRRRRRITRPEGVVLLVSYAAFIVLAAAGW